MNIFQKNVQDFLNTIIFKIFYYITIQIHRIIYFIEVL